MSETTSISPDIATRIRGKLRNSGMTQEALARKAGIPLNTLSQILIRRVKCPSVPILLAISRALGTTVSDLIGETHDGHR